MDFFRINEDYNKFLQKYEKNNGKENSHLPLDLDGAS